MDIIEHPRGQIITLDRSEAFPVTDPAGGPSLRAEIITTFTRPTGDEPEPYFTVAGNEITPLGRFNELPHRFRDAGLLPPHVRRHVEGVEVLDFGPNLAATGTTLAHDVQAGRLPVDAIHQLPRKDPQVNRGQVRTPEQIRHLRSLGRGR